MKSPEMSITTAASLTGDKHIKVYTRAIMVNLSAAAKSGHNSRTCFKATALMRDRLTLKNINFWQKRWLLETGITVTGHTGPTAIEGPVHPKWGNHSVLDTHAHKQPDPPPHPYGTDNDAVGAG